ncbi:MAG: J domain-containing protein [Pseudomonadota bacterium]
MSGHYDTLLVHATASSAAIRLAYRTLAQKYHPDKNPHDTERAAAHMQRLNAAYEVLSDPVQRAAYDALQTPAQGVLHSPSDFDHLVEEASQWWQATAPAPLHPQAPPTHAQVVMPPPLVTPPPRWQPLALVGLVVLLLVGSALWGLWRASTHQAPPLAPTAGAQLLAAAPPSTAVSTPQQLYRQVVAELEARHPALNPRSPSYRKDLVAQAKTRAQAYVQQGQAAHVALAQAVRDMEQAALASKTSPQITPGTTVAQRLAISVACGDPPAEGDVTVYQTCARRALAGLKP